MGPLVLAKNFLMVAGPGQAFRSQWAAVDSEFQFATIHAHCQTIAPIAATMGFLVTLESSFDTVESYQIGAPLPVATPSSQSAAVTSNLGPLVRLAIENQEAFALVGILSVWLQPKTT